MTPLTKEQAEALVGLLLSTAQYAEAIGEGRTATVLIKLAAKIRNGTFIEVQP